MLFVCIVCGKVGFSHEVPLVFQDRRFSSQFCIQVFSEWRRAETHKTLYQFYLDKKFNGERHARVPPS